MVAVTPKQLLFWGFKVVIAAILDVAAAVAIRFLVDDRHHQSTTVAVQPALANGGVRAATAAYNDDSVLTLQQY